MVVIIKNAGFFDPDYVGRRSVTTEDLINISVKAINYPNRYRQPSFYVIVPAPSMALYRETTEFLDENAFLAIINGELYAVNQEKYQQFFNGLNDRRITRLFNRKVFFNFPGLGDISLLTQAEFSQKHFSYRQDR